jgi:hypothetical protein
MAGCSSNFGLNENKEQSLVGVYKTDSWNGKSGTLVLYKDGTCLYPTGDEGQWELSGDVVRITLKSPITLCVFLNENLSTAEARAVGADINLVDNVLYSMLCEAWSESESRYIEYYEVTLERPDEDKDTYNALVRIQGVSRIEQKSNVIEPRVHIAKVMESGLVLHECYFEKVSN